MDSSDEDSGIEEYDEDIEEYQIEDAEIKSFLVTHATKINSGTYSVTQLIRDIQNDEILKSSIDYFVKLNSFIELYCTFNDINYSD